jgi:hypothetical protein
MSAATSGHGVSVRQLPEFDMGRVLRQSWTILTQSFLLLITIQIVGTAFGSPLFRYVYHSPKPRLSSTMTLLTLLALWMAAVFVAVMTSALVTLIVSQTLHGEPLSLRKNLRYVLTRAPSIFATALVAGLIVMIGFLLLIVPGLIALTACIVVIPVCVLERQSPSNSLDRSYGLSRYHRWPIFVLLLAYGALGFLLDRLVQLVWVNALHHSQASPWLPVANAVIACVPAAYLAVVIVLLYWHLRECKEGVAVTDPLTTG